MFTVHLPAPGPSQSRWPRRCTARRLRNGAWKYGRQNQATTARTTMNEPRARPIDSTVRRVTALSARPSAKPNAAYPACTSGVASNAGELNGPNGWYSVETALTLLISLIAARPRPTDRATAGTPSSTTLPVNHRIGVTSWLHTTRWVRCSYSRDSSGAAQKTAMARPIVIGAIISIWAASA